MVCGPLMRLPRALQTLALIGQEDGDGVGANCATPPRNAALSIAKLFDVYRHVKIEFHCGKENAGEHAECLLNLRLMIRRHSTLYAGDIE